MAKGEKIQIWEKYEVEGDHVERKGKTCPRCGGGVFLANHDDRVTCGRCGFSEIRSSD